MRLPEPDRQYLASEVAAYLDQLREPASRRLYGELQTAVAQGEAPEELLEALGALLELSLSSGRLRRLYGPHAEMSAARLFARCPQGQRQADAISEVNRALEALKGRRLRKIEFALRGPGAYMLTAETDRWRVRLVIERDAVRVQALEPFT